MADPLSFDRQSLAQRVVFGPGTATTQLAAEARRLGGTRVLVIAGPSQAGRVTQLTASLPVAASFPGSREHVPAAVAEAARALAAGCGADLLLSIGGGSATGTAKAVALTSGLPILAVPTTYAGSEATPVWGLTESGRKATGTDGRTLPRTVVYDPELTLTLPVPVSMASGLNAMAHGVDSLWAPRSNPVTRLLAAEAIRELAEALPLVHDDGSDLQARGRCLYAAYLGAAAFAEAGSGLHHRICHVLGGYGLPHAPTHSVMLPHVLAFNAAALPAAGALVASALGGTDPVAELTALQDRVGAPRALRDLGMPRGRLGEAAVRAAGRAPEASPRPVTAAALRALLERAWAGDPPGM